MKIFKSRDASGRLFANVDKMPAFKYRIIRWALCRQFGLKKTSTYTKGLNEKCQAFANHSGQVSVDWDTWSGFIVTSLNPESEDLLEEIYDWLKAKYEYE